MIWLICLSFWFIPTIIFFLIWYTIWKKETKEEYLYQFLTGDRFVGKYDLLIPPILVMLTPAINLIWLCIWLLSDVREYYDIKCQFKWFNIKLRKTNEQN